MKVPSIGRRDFMKAAAAALGAAASVRAAGSSLRFLAPRTQRATDARVDILLDERIGPITADIYGHFVEHLGGVVYDGI